MLGPVFSAKQKLFKDIFPTQTQFNKKIRYLLMKYIKKKLNLTVQLKHFIYYVFEWTAHQKQKKIEFFYEKFYKNKSLEEKKIGMIGFGLPSQKKVDAFYRKGI